MSENKTVKTRNSSIELLRILAMIMIVFHHFAINGGFEWEAGDVTIPHFWYNLIIMGGKIGVDVFILISGYFLIEDESGYFNIKRILKFWGQVFFYAITVIVIFGIAGKCSITGRTLIEAFLPITFSKWWFASGYFVLYLLHPFINKLLKALDKAAYQKLLVLLVICWSIIPTFTTSPYQSNPLLWFMTLYAIAGYIKLYGLNPKLETKHYAVMWLVFSVITYGSSAIFTVLGSKIGLFTNYITYLYEQEKLTILLISVSLFMVFATLKMNYHKWINVIASATFGVYLIHDHDVVRQFLWMDVFKNAAYKDYIMLIPYSIIVVAVVYVVCTLIDLARIYIIEKPVMKLVNRYSEKLIKPFEKVTCWIKGGIFGK